MKILNVQQYGDNLSVLIDDGNKIIAYPTGGQLWMTRKNTYKVAKVLKFGSTLSIIMDDGTIVITYPSLDSTMWVARPNEFTEPIELVDTISPGHNITNPGGTLKAAWDWHVANNGQGGTDWNYNFQTIKAPGKGTVTHFDVSGVGMVIKLVLDSSVARKDAQYDSDAFGPLRAIWFQHCSEANDGAVNQGDTIGKSGDGYGSYAAHLHVHGQTNTDNTSGASLRCNLWGFM